MKKILNEWRQFQEQTSVAPAGAEVQPFEGEKKGHVYFYFTKDEIEKINSILKSHHDSSLLKSSYVYKRQEERKAVAEQDTQQTMVDPEDEEDVIDFKKRKKDFDRPDELPKDVKDMEPKDFEGKRWVIEIPEEIVSNIKDIIGMAQKGEKVMSRDEYEEARDWYSTLRRLCKPESGIVSDSKYSGLLAYYIAAFSPRTAFKSNFREALTMLKAFEWDVQNQKDEIEKFVRNERIRGRKDAKEKAAKWDHLASYHAWKNLMTLASSKWTNYANITTKYFDMWNQMTLESALKEVKKDIKLTTRDIGSLALGTKQRNIVGRTKVANFAMNIINPEEAQKEKYKLNVTIDTWMVRAFYPNIDNEADVFNDPHSYYYIASHVAQLADELGLSPPEMQAIIWVHTIKQETPNAQVTASKMKTLFYNSVAQEIKMANMGREVGGGFETLQRAAKQYVSQFNDIEDFKNLGEITGKDDGTQQSLFGDV